MKLQLRENSYLFVMMSFHLRTAVIPFVSFRDVIFFVGFAYFWLNLFLVID